MLHFLFASVYMPLVAILGTILILGIGGKGTWHRLSFFDGYAQVFLLGGKELYEAIAGSSLQSPIVKYSRLALAVIGRLTFSTVFLIVMPAFMFLSLVVSLFNRK
jgi:hypothetical protein